ncbi:MAG: serine/threonine protein kinase [Actinomycetota bacterium]|nr:serine/threonine protein kinase [Actinomycetota bacterium]
MTDSDLTAPLLLDRYQPEALLARGGSASVYRARDLLLGRDVAVKVFLAGSEPDLARAREELRLLAQLGHHGIVAVLDAGIDESSPGDPRPFLVMELLRGDTVRELIDDGQLPEQMVGGIAFEIAEALEYIHRRGVIHRDVSPSNIMLVDYGSIESRPRARLTDFGIAVQSGWMPPSDDVTEGTAAYLSPEQALRYRLTTAADVYSLGLVLLECFTGERAFPGDPVESAMARTEVDPGIPKTVPRAWRGLIGAMTRREPAERPTAAEVLEQVRQILRASRR